MEHDQTDLDPGGRRGQSAFGRRNKRSRARERAAVEASGKEWHWVHRDGEIEPSYAVSGEIGAACVSTPRCSRQRAAHDAEA